MVKYHGLAHRHLRPHRLLMRQLLNGVSVNIRAGLRPMSDLNEKQLLMQLHRVLQEIGEARLAKLVDDALAASDEVLGAFLMSNTLWGGAGSIADQVGTNRIDRRKVEAALVTLGQQQVAAGTANARTSGWIETFKKWQRDGI